MNLPNSQYFIYAAIIYFLTIIALHNFKWDLLFGRPLPRVACYTIGLSALIFSFWIWSQDLAVTIGLTLLAIAGGAADLVSYGANWLGKIRFQNRINKPSWNKKTQNRHDGTSSEN